MNEVKLFLVILLLICSNTVLAQTVEDIVSPVRVSLEMPKVSMRNLCDILGDKSKLNLKIDARCSDQLFCVSIHDQKIVDVLACLERIVPGKWKRQNSTTFSFVPDSAHLLQKQRWWNAYQSERASVLQQQENILVHLMNQQVREREIETVKDLNMRQAVRNAAEKQLFWLSLAPSQQQRIARDFDSTDTYRRFYSSLAIRREGGSFLSWSELSEKTRAAILTAGVRHGQNLAGKTATGVIITTTGLCCMASLVFQDGTQMDTGVELNIPYYTVPPTFFVDHRFLSALIADREKHPVTVGGRAMKTMRVPRSWLRFAKDQKKTFWTGDFGKVVSEVMPQRWVDVVQQAAKCYQFDYISDYYSLPYKPMQKNPLNPKLVPIEEHLNRISTEQDRSWKKQGNIVLFRHNRWYREDYLEARDKKVSVFVKKHKSVFGGLAAKAVDPASVESYLNACTELIQEFSLWNIANGLRYYVQEDALAADDKALENDYQPIAGMSETVLQHYHLLTFYATLTPEQKTACLSKGLLSSDLNPTQIQSLIAAAPAKALTLQSPILIKVALNESLVHMHMVGEDVFSSATGGESRYKLRLSFSQPQ